MRQFVRQEMAEIEKFSVLKKKACQALRHLTSHHRSVHVKNLKYGKNMY